MHDDNKRPGGGHLASATVSSTPRHIEVGQEGRAGSHRIWRAGAGTSQADDALVYIGSSGFAPPSTTDDIIWVPLSNPGSAVEYRHNTCVRAAAL